MKAKGLLWMAILLWGLFPWWHYEVTCQDRRGQIVTFSIWSPEPLSLDPPRFCRQRGLRPAQETTPFMYHPPERGGR